MGCGPARSTLRLTCRQSHWPQRLRFTSIMSYVVLVGAPARWDATFSDYGDFQPVVEAFEERFP